MRSILPLLCVLMVPATAATSDGDVVIQGNISPLNILPTFDHGYLATYGKDGIAVYAPNGSLATEIRKPADGNFVNADIDSDGSVAVAVHRSGRRSGSIAIFSPDGSAGGEIATGPYRPSQVCLAPDHSIWVLGDEDLLPENEGTNHFLLRHYSRGGELLGEFLPRTSFPADAYPGEPRAGFWKLRIADGRLGMKLDRSAPDKKLLWLETDLQGKEIGRWTAPSGGEPAAFTASGAVYAETADGIKVLDRASGAWNSVPRSSSDRLLGAEGDTLVFAIPGMNEIRRATKP
jgi:hypothetical protein